MGARTDLASVPPGLASSRFVGATGSWSGQGYHRLAEPSQSPGRLDDQPPEIPSAGVVVGGTVTGPPGAGVVVVGAWPAAEGLPAPEVSTRSVSSVPVLAVVTKPPMLGLAMFQSAKVIGMSARTLTPLPVRLASTVNDTGRVTPCMVSVPAAG
jgi:hypothetical protein